MTIDKGLCERMASEVKAALEPIAANHGLKLIMKGGTYDEGMWKPRFEFAVMADNGVKASNVDQFNKYCDLFGLKPEHLGKTFRSNGHVYTIAGLDINRRKFPIIAIDENGKRMLFTESVTRLLQVAS